MWNSREVVKPKLNICKSCGTTTQYPTTCSSCKLREDFNFKKKIEEEKKKIEEKKKEAAKRKFEEMKRQEVVKRIDEEKRDYITRF